MSDPRWNNPTGHSDAHIRKSNRYAAIGVWLTAIGLVLGTVIPIVLNNQSSDQTNRGQGEDSTPSPTPTPTPSDSATPVETWLVAQEQVGFLFPVPEHGSAGGVGGCPAIVMDFDIQFDEGWELTEKTNDEADASGRFDLRWWYCDNEFLTINPSADLQWARGGTEEADEPEQCAQLARDGVENDQIPWAVHETQSEWTVEKGGVFCLLTDQGRAVRVKFTGFYLEDGEPPWIGLDLIAWEPAS